MEDFIPDYADYAAWITSLATGPRHRTVAPRPDLTRPQPASGQNQGYLNSYGWSPTSNALLRFEFMLSGDLPYLQLALSPKNETNNFLRLKLFETGRQKPQLFKPNTNSLSGHWIHLHQSDYILDEADFGVGWDDGTTRAKLEKWIADFAAHEFPAMNEVIIGCLQEIDAERQVS